MKSHLIIFVDEYQVILSLLAIGQPVMLIGEQGSAKTVMINAHLKQHQTEDQWHRTFNFSSATTAFQFQRMVEGCVDKRMGNTYGPPAGKKVLRGQR